MTFARPIQCGAAILRRDRQDICLSVCRRLQRSYASIGQPGHVTYAPLGNVPGNRKRGNPNILGPPYTSPLSWRDVFRRPRKPLDAPSKPVVAGSNPAGRANTLREPGFRAIQHVVGRRRENSAQVALKSNLAVAGIRTGTKNGDPYGNRTRASAVKGPRPNR
jgi:hypothetical protein